MTPVSEGRLVGPKSMLYIGWPASMRAVLMASQPVGLTCFDLDSLIRV